MLITSIQIWQSEGAFGHYSRSVEPPAMDERHAKIDGWDARHLRELLATGRLPESRIPPAHVLEVRTQVRSCKALTDGHTAWLQRVQDVIPPFRMGAASALFLPVTLTVAGFSFSIGAWAGVRVLGAASRSLRAQGIHSGARRLVCRRSGLGFGGRNLIGASVWWWELHQGVHDAGSVVQG
jgi:transposase